MPIHIKAIERPQPGVTGGGVKSRSHLYPRPGKKLQDLFKTVKFAKV